MTRQSLSSLLPELCVLVILAVPALGAQSTAKSSGNASPPVQARTRVNRAIAFNSSQTLGKAETDHLYDLGFHGVQGQVVSFAEVNDAHPCRVINFSILKPDGSALASKSVCGSGSLSNITLPATMNYRVQLDPGSVGSDVSITLTQKTVLQLTANKPENVRSSLPGQVFDLTFEGRAGQRVTVTETNNKYPCGTMDFFIMKPDGSPLASSYHVCGTSSLKNETLPASGTYKVFVNPGSASGGATFALSGGGH